jgi:hypothetical protein
MNKAFFILFFFAIMAFGQEQDLSLLLRMGFNYSNVDETYMWGWSKRINTDSRFGLQAMAMLDKKLVGQFYIQPGIRLIQKGATYNGYYERYEISLLYLGIFLLPTVKISSNEKSAFEIYCGPYFDFRLAEKSAVSEKLFSPIDFGYSVGVGITFGKFYVGIFYDLGLKEVSNLDYFHTYNRTFGINWGYRK